MSIIKRSADLVYTFRFIRLLTTDFKDTEAFELGIIDADGERINKGERLDRKQKNAYTSFHRLVFNIKKLLSTGPGRGRIASYVSALYLLREKYDLRDSDIEKIFTQSGIDMSDVIEENSEWYICENKLFSPGIYKTKNSKLINKTCEELINVNDRIRIEENTYPVGELLGMDIYEAIHEPTKQKIYVTAGELAK